MHMWFWMRGRCKCAFFFMFICLHCHQQQACEAAKDPSDMKEPGPKPARAPAWCRQTGVVDGPWLIMLHDSSYYLTYGRWCYIAMNEPMVYDAFSAGNLWSWCLIMTNDGSALFEHHHNQGQAWFALFSHQFTITRPCWYQKMNSTSPWSTIIAFMSFTTNLYIHI